MKATISRKFDNCWTKADVQLKEPNTWLVFCPLFLWRNWWSIFLVFIKLCPFCYAAFYDLHNTILKRFLLNEGVDIDLVNTNRNLTSLFVALACKASNNTTTLLWHGASTNTRDSFNITLMIFAQHLGGNIAKLLRQWMRMKKLKILFENFIFYFCLFPFLVGNTTCCCRRHCPEESVQEFFDISFIGDYCFIYFVACLRKTKILYK